MVTKVQRGTGEQQDGPDRTAPTIQTVERAALILGSFTVGKPHMSLNEITARLGASKATAHRYTKALRAANLLRYDERTSLYSLGPQVLTLAAAARAGLPIVAAAEPYMESLVRRIDETIVLSVWDGESATVVRSVDNTDHMVRISVRVGSRLNLTSSAQGRVFLAFLPPEQVPALPRAVRRSAELNDELDAIRKHGLSVNSPTVNGVRTIAAPIFDGDKISGTLAIVGTTATVPDDVASPMAQALVETARALSQRLGNSEDGPGGD
ncbi:MULTISPECIES: IclR family transcriptional regulator [Streptomyces]|uniref:IclR family transcriptional regulator n=1 Tax=Streptomyces TaxID=1883 RepID=UPI0015F1103B|nr:IclR family transcriptional regulator [Streptomyces shenzhenensis]